MIRVAFVVGEYPPEEQKRREDTALAYSSQEVQVGIVRVGATPYIHGLTPAELSLVTPASFAANRDKVIANFVAAARSLIEKERADVIIPMGISQCPVHIKPDWLSKQLGVPVVEGIGSPIRVAAAMAHLGLKHSRKRWPKSP